MQKGAGLLMGPLSNFFGGLRRSRSGSFSRDGSSRRGRRLQDTSARSGQDEPSNKDSSTHSALFDLELSHRSGAAGRAGDLLARLNPTVHDEGSGGAATGDPSVRVQQALLQRVIYLGRPVMEFELDLLQDVRALRSTCSLQPDGQLDLHSMVLQLQELGYACYLKRNNPADPGHRHNVQPSCLEKLRHEYIMCAGKADGSLAHWCLVDPRFREQFAIAQPTPTYDRLLKAVPHEFVGTPLRLQALVETLSAEMAEAFLAQQLTLPPWRKCKSMLSKWFDPEEMPGQQAPPPAPQAPVLPPPPPAPLQRPSSTALAAAAAAQQQLIAAAEDGDGMTSPFQAVSAVAPPGWEAGDAVAAAAMHLAPSGSGGAASGGGGKQTLLQQQAAAALAERQSSGGGSQNFYEALAMHQESMRLQQAAAVAAVQKRQSPPRAAAAAAALMPAAQQPVPATGVAQLPPQGQQQSCAAPSGAAGLGRLSAEGLRQLDAAYYAATGMGKSGGGSGSGRLDWESRLPERSNKPRRRAMRPPPAASSQHPHQPLWGGGDPEGDKSGHGGTAAHAGMMVNLHASGSWSDLSTIMETRSNASSPAAVALLNAAVLGTSAASRRSVGSMAATGLAAGAGAGAGVLPPPRRSPTIQPQPSSSAAGSFEALQLGPGSAAASVKGADQASPSSTTASVAGSDSAAVLAAVSAASAASEYGASEGAGSKKKVVSLLAKGLKSVGQKQTWSNLLPTVNTVRRSGPDGMPTVQRTWSWRSGGNSDSDASRSGRRHALQEAHHLQQKLQVQQ